jgi:hypothetical protein
MHQLLFKKKKKKEKNQHSPLPFQLLTSAYTTTTT